MPFASQSAAQVTAGRGGVARKVTPPAAEEGTIILQPATSTRLAEARDLTLDDYRWIDVILKTQISSSATSGSNTYQVPPDQNFMVTDIRGYISLVLPSAESLAVASLGNLSVQDRYVLKAGNTKIDLQIQDRSLKVFDNNSWNLLSILSILGGNSIDMRVAPHPVPAGSQLLMNASVYDTTASIIGQATDVGVTLSGYLVRIAR